MTNSMFAPDTSAETFVERHTPWGLPADPTEAHRLHSSWVSLMNARADSLCPLRRVESGGEYVTLVHLVPPEGIPLAMIRARGPLRLGQALAVGVRLADALTALHDERTAHGAIGLDAALVDRRGQVFLAGAGLWRLAPHAGGPVATDDVRDLAMLMHELVGSGSFPTSLELLLMKAQDPDPFLRPSLHDLTSTMLRRPARQVSAQNPVAGEVRARARESVASAQTPQAQSKSRLFGLERLRPRIV